MDRALLKSNAKEQIKGKIGTFFLINLVIGIISGVASSLLGLIPFVGSILNSLLVLGPFSLSLAMIYLATVNGVEFKVSSVFDGFSDFWSAAKAYFFLGLFTFLWALLLIIPGIIKAYSYSMTMFILAENKGMPALEAIKKSQEMMNGHKMDYFVLELSFIGWGLLTVITFGIAGIWIVPYMQTTYANFYQSLKPVEVETVLEPVIESIPQTEE